MENPEFDRVHDVWAEALIEKYWVPGDAFERLGSLKRDVLDANVGADWVPHQSAFRVLIESVESVRDFLSFPYAISKGIMDHAGVPDPVGQYHRLKIFVTVIKTPPVVDQLQRMKQQATVLLWSAYETFARDTFVALLNAVPSLYSNLVKSPLKDKFNSPNLFSFQGLEREEFSLVGKLGSLLAEGRDFSSPALLRTLFPVLLPNSKYAERLSEATESPFLWRLGHQRHLVAHRGGVVDQGYLNQTGDKTQEVGVPLLITGREIDQYIAAIVKAVAIISVCLLDNTKEEAKPIAKA